MIGRFFRCIQEGGRGFHKEGDIVIVDKNAWGAAQDWVVHNVSQKYQVETYRSTLELLNTRAYEALSEEEATAYKLSM